MKLLPAFDAAVTVLAGAVSRHAQEGVTAAAVAPADIRQNSWVWPANGRREGRVTVIKADSVSVIYNAKIVRVPLSILSPAEKGLATSLTRKEIDRL